MMINRILIGGSAGSIKDFLYLTKNLDNSMLPPIICAFHQSKHMTLNSLIATNCKLKLQYVDRSMNLEPNTVYVSKPGYHIIMTNDGNSVQLFDDEHFSFSKPSIDLLFYSCFGHESISTLAILLSGANNDGMSGFESLFDGGAHCAVVAPEDSAFNYMPKSGLEVVPTAKLIHSSENLNYVLKVLEGH